MSTHNPKMSEENARKSNACEDIELTVLKRDLNLSDDTIDQIMRDLDVNRCEKCNIELTEDFSEHKICEECLFAYCMHCVSIIFSDVSCICIDCAMIKSHNVNKN